MEEDVPAKAHSIVVIGRVGVEGIRRRVSTKCLRGDVRTSVLDSVELAGVLTCKRVYRMRRVLTKLARKVAHPRELLVGLGDENGRREGRELSTYTPFDIFPY